MSDPELKQALQDKGFYQPVQERGVSQAVAFFSQQNVGVSELGDLALPDGSSLVLKPLSEVYSEAKSPAGEPEIMALCMAIEYAIAFFDHTHDHGLNDGDTIRVLEKLSMKPELPLSGFGGLVQAYLRLELSLGEYSRADLRQAVRKTLRSAERHTKGDPRGYLNFIHHVMH